MSKKLRCSIYNTTAPDLSVYFRSHLKGQSLTIQHTQLTAANVDPNCEILCVFVSSKVTKEIFAKLPKLKLVVAMSTGYDNIDLAEAKKRGIPVCNVPTYGENTVAEHAMALILGLSRRIYDSVKRVKEGRFNYEDLRGFDLKGKTVGVIGVGHIGLHLIDMLRGFDMHILGFNPHPKKELEKIHGFTYTALPKLLAESDIISLHVPLLPETTHLINKKNIKKIKKGAYIINTARGGLIETEALVWGLENGHIAGAGLDVLEGEGFIQFPKTILDEKKQSRPATDRVVLLDNMLIDHPRVLITPHNAFNSGEAILRIFATTVENVFAFANNKPQNLISFKK